MTVTYEQSYFNHLRAKEISVSHMFVSACQRADDPFYVPLTALCHSYLFLPADDKPLCRQQCHTCLQASVTVMCKTVLRHLRAEINFAVVLACGQRFARVLSKATGKDEEMRGVGV